MSQTEVRPISLPEEEPQVGEPVPPAGALDEATEKILEGIKPYVLNRAHLGRLALADKCYLELRAKLDEEMAKPIPTREKLKAQWKILLREHVRYLRLRFGLEHHLETVRVLKGQMGRRILEIRQEVETNTIHRIQRKLGKRFLDVVPSEPQRQWSNAQLRSMRRGETSQSQPPPSACDPKA
jgi:hypothetical protein